MFFLFFHLNRDRVGNWLRVAGHPSHNISFINKYVLIRAIEGMAKAPSVSFQLSLSHQLQVPTPP